MKITIIGAGITGLSSYLFLKKYLPNQSFHNIIIYERYEPAQSNTANYDPDVTSPFENVRGAGLALSPNGVRVLRALSPDIHSTFLARGFVAKKFDFRTAGNWSLGTSPTDDRLEPKEEGCVAISRQGLQDILKAEVPEGVVVYKEAKGVRIIDGKRPVVLFLDGGEEEADLVLGADGVGSLVRRSLFGESDSYAAQYQGTLGVGGFISIPDTLPYDRESMVFAMGPTGTFGYSGASQNDMNQIMYWSSYSSNLLPKKGEVTADDVRILLRQRHKAWKDPIIQHIIENSTVDTIWPQRITPDLPYWGRGGILLLGDAAHAITPNTGQGASMALQDSQVFAMLIARGLEKFGDEGKTIETAISGLYDLRHKKVAEIQRRAMSTKGSGSEPSVVQAFLIYAVLWVVFHIKPIGKLLYGNMPQLLNQDADKEVAEYLAEK